MIRVGFFDPDHARKEEPKIYGCSALVDTGATRSCISPLVAERIGLLPDESITIAAASGTYETARYAVGIVVPDVGILQEKINVAEVALSKSNNFQALLGMDILLKGSFHLDFSNHFVFCA